MNTRQYTIRSIPKNLDTFLKSQARLQGKSLNQTVLDYITRGTKLEMQNHEDDFSWIIGANTIDEKSLRAIGDLKKSDKAKQAN